MLRSQTSTILFAIALFRLGSGSQCPNLRDMSLVDQACADCGGYKLSSSFRNGRGTYRCSCGCRGRIRGLHHSQRARCPDVTAVPSGHGNLCDFFKRFCGSRGESLAYLDVVNGHGLYRCTSCSFPAANVSVGTLDKATADLKLKDVPWQVWAVITIAVAMVWVYQKIVAKLSNFKEPVYPWSLCGPACNYPDCSSSGTDVCVLITEYFFTPYYYWDQNANRFTTHKSLASFLAEEQSLFPLICGILYGNLHIQTTTMRIVYLFHYVCTTASVAIVLGTAQKSVAQPLSCGYIYKGQSTQASFSLSGRMSYKTESGFVFAAINPLPVWAWATTSVVGFVLGTLVRKTFAAVQFSLKSQGTAGHAGRLANASYIFTTVLSVAALFSSIVLYANAREGSNAETISQMDGLIVSTLFAHFSIQVLGRDIICGPIAFMVTAFLWKGSLREKCCHSGPSSPNAFRTKNARIVPTIALVIDSSDRVPNKHIESAYSLSTSPATVRANACNLPSVHGYAVGPTPTAAVPPPDAPRLPHTTAPIPPPGGHSMPPAR